MAYRATRRFAQRCRWRRAAKCWANGRCEVVKDVLIVEGGQLRDGHVAKFRYIVVDSKKFFVLARKSIDWNRFLLGQAARKGGLWKRKVFRMWFERLNIAVNNDARLDNGRSPSVHRNWVTIKLPKVPNSRQTHEIRALKYRGVLSMEATLPNLSWLHGYAVAARTTTQPKVVPPIKPAMQSPPIQPPMPEVPLLEETPAVNATSSKNVPILEHRMCFVSDLFHKHTVTETVQADIRSFFSGQPVVVA